jgi:SWI/SNF-related matrix-associated actin-dependent regulator 1 of chromatin subfamily A
MMLKKILKDKQKINMTIKLTYSNGLFKIVGAVGFHNIDKIQKAGFKNNKTDGWFTTKMMSASLLRDYADEKAENIFRRAFLRHSPWKGALVIPKKLTLLSHQPTAATYALSRNKSYLALAPGLGKTIVAAIIAATLNGRALYVCPPFLAINTMEEFKKWAPSLTVGVLGKNDWEVPDVLIVPDSMIHSLDVIKYIWFFKPKVFIGDEFHRFSNPKSLRSKGMYGYRDNRKKIYVPGILDCPTLEKSIPMSGTPMSNRPIELHPMLYKLAPEYIKFFHYDEYGMQYCSPRWNGFGYDFTGCNRKEFKALMDRVKSVDAHDPKGFMLRLNKDILGLPKLTEEMMMLGSDMPPVLKGLEREILKRYSSVDLMKAIIAQEMGTNESDLHLATYRRMLGMYKVKPSIEFITSILEETDDAIFVYAIHTDVIHELAVGLEAYSPIVVTGKIKSKQTRQNMVNEFQSNKLRRIFIGNIDAVGIGYTLTKANRVIGVERSLVTGINRQITDRVHRYTLEHEVLHQVLMFRNSYDKTQYEMLENKEQITSYV